MSYRVLHRDETAVGASRHDDLVGADPPSEAVDVGSPLLVREWRTTPTCATASGIEHEDAVAIGEGGEARPRLGHRTESGGPVMHDHHRCVGVGAQNLDVQLVVV